MQKTAFRNVKDRLSEVKRYHTDYQQVSDYDKKHLRYLDLICRLKLIHTVFIIIISISS